MVFKQIVEPGGDWINARGHRVTLLAGNVAYTPDGVNVGWSEFETEEECAQAWGLIYQPEWQNPDEPPGA